MSYQHRDELLLQVYRWRQCDVIEKTAAIYSDVDSDGVNQLKYAHACHSTAQSINLTF